MRIRLVVVVSALAAGAIGAGFSAAPGAPACSSGADVRNLTESNVPQSLKDKIFAPGPVVNTSSSLYPSGKVVVIRAAMADWPANTAVTASYIDQIFFSSSPGTMSVRGYFARNSWGSFQVTKGAVPAWITLSKKQTDYVNGLEANSTYVATC